MEELVHTLNLEEVGELSVFIHHSFSGGESGLINEVIEFNLMINLKNEHA